MKRWFILVLAVVVVLAAGVVVTVAIAGTLLMRRGFSARDEERQERAFLSDSDDARTDENDSTRAEALTHPIHHH